MKAFYPSNGGPPLSSIVRLDKDHFGDRLTQFELRAIPALDVSAKVEICAVSPAVMAGTHPLQKGHIYLHPDGAAFVWTETTDEAGLVCVKPSVDFAIGSIHSSLPDVLKTVGKGVLRLKGQN